MLQKVDAFQFNLFRLWLN